MLFHTKKIKKNLYQKITSDDILRCHLFPHLPEIIWDLCSQKKTLKKFLVLSVSKILSNEAELTHSIIDEFRSEFEDLIYFLTNDEESLTELEQKFKVFIWTLSKKFFINKEMFNFLVLIVGFFLRESRKTENDLSHHSKINALKKEMGNLLKFNVRFKTLKARLFKLDQIFIEKIAELVLKWKNFFEQ